MKGPDSWGPGRGHDNLRGSSAVPTPVAKGALPPSGYRTTTPSLSHLRLSSESSTPTPDE